MNINPIQMLTEMSKTNPNVASVMNAIQNGQNPQQLFYTLAKQMGVDPNAILKMINR